MRDNANHIPVSDEQVEEYNALADKVELDWDAEINNDPFASEETIIKTITNL
jgi:hypothetical protein